MIITNNLLIFTKWSTPVAIFGAFLITIFGAYSITDYNNLGIERKAASRYLNGLEEIGILKSQQKGKEVIYINTKLYNLLKKG